MLKYDAWNRLAKLTTGGSVQLVLATYDYDALGRRIRVVKGQRTTDLYYSSAWQVLEEDQGGAMQAQYVWSPVYIDAMIERDTADGTRLYAQQDGNYNVTALVGLVSGNWQVLQRFVYDPYGKPTVLDANFNGTTDQYNWVYLHQGGRYDALTGLYYFRDRDFSPTLGRWMQVDPAGYDAGSADLYSFLNNSPADATDPLGLAEKMTVNPHQDYAGFPRDVHEFLGIAYDLLLSGQQNEDVAATAAAVIDGGFTPWTFFGTMTTYCKKAHGDDWSPVPIEFRLTGLQFYPTTKSGGLAQGPRTGKIQIPVLVKAPGKNPELKVETTSGKYALAHFLIEGFWVFQVQMQRKGVWKIRNSDRRQGAYLDSRAIRQEVRRRVEGRPGQVSKAPGQ